MYPEGGDRNAITSYLGSMYDDAALMRRCGHPVIESVSVDLDGPCRLLLASDGAYEPHEDAGHDLYAELDDDPLGDVATAFVDLAVETSLRATAAAGNGVMHRGPYADNATVLLSDLA